MAQRERGNCCTCCTSFIISTGLTALFLWLTLRTQHPKCFLQSLNTTTTTTTSHNSHHHSNSNSNTNTTIVFQLKFANPNKDKGVHYDAVLLALGLFTDANTTRPLANATLDAFYQGHGKTAEKWGSAEARGAGVNRTADGRVFFRVEFATHVKYKILLFYTKRHRLSGGANVEVNVSSGQKVDPEGIRLGNVPPRVGSEAARVRGCCVALLRFFCLSLVSLCLYLG